MFALVVARLAKALPHVEVLTFLGAGHIPHATHPEGMSKRSSLSCASTGIRYEPKERNHETDETTQLHGSPATLAST